MSDGQSDESTEKREERPNLMLETWNISYAFS